MMNFPLTIERFQQEQEFKDSAGTEFIKTFISAINGFYEKGRRAKDSRPRLTVEMIKEWYEQTYNEKCESEEDNMFFDIYTKYANDAYQQGVKDSEGVFDIPTGTVNIYPCFAAHEPKPEKMQQKEQYFKETGALQSQIIIDSRGNLIDGYTSYLIAKAQGMESVFVKYGRRQIIRASHRSGGKLYAWELPGLLIDRVHIGDKVIVRTERGFTAVTVAAVEEYAGQEQEPLRMVIRVKKRAGSRREACINMINQQLSTITDTWILEQIYRMSVNITR